MSMLRSVVKSFIAKLLFRTDLAFNRQRFKDLRLESTVEEDQAGIDNNRSSSTRVMAMCSNPY